MFVIYAPQDPADGDRQEWAWDANRIKANEGQVLLKEFGETSWDLFVQGVKINNPHARRVLLWHLMRRSHPLMRFSDTPEFFIGEVTVELDSDELIVFRDKVQESSQASLPADKDMMISALEAEIEQAQKREAELGKSSGSPISSTESTTTG